MRMFIELSCWKTKGVENFPQVFREEVHEYIERERNGNEKRSKELPTNLRRIRTGDSTVERLYILDSTFEFSEFVA
ncbi:hypothetical protein EVAR_15062_1 [Eumeta japonica]|uniref:Uncharacterized protein n=1 Tax=Eumeta variegata TaxID=151549 RepID=A0A4C1YL34_EUMVA|nr:hypothetical protein EVAR_15062_1 [Eumeta japonica]